MSCDLQIMANLQKNYRTRVFISRKLTRMLFVRACLCQWLGVHHILIMV